MANGKKILVVDDDPDVVDQVTAILGADGYEVAGAGGEEEADEALLAGRPDLVILDLMMEHMDSGFVLAHRIRKLYPETTMILMTAVTAATGMSFADRSAEALSWLKADCVLDKPVRAEQLKAEVRRALNRPADG